MGFTRFLLAGWSGFGNCNTKSPKLRSSSDRNYIDLDLFPLIYKAISSSNYSSISCPLSKATYVSYKFSPYII